MFKDEYIKANENINPDESTKRYIKAKLSEPAEKPAIRFNYNAVIAAALSLVLALGVIFIAKKPSFDIAPQNLRLNQKVTYQTVYNTINNYWKQYDEYFMLREEGFSNIKGDPGFAVDNSADMDDGATTGTANTGEASTTNNQVQGVDEADVVKNDGKYIYSVKNGNIIITDSNDGDPKVVNKHFLDQNDKQVKGLFVNGNRLAVILSRYSAYETTASLLIFDITDKENIIEIANKQQDGWYNNARMVGGTVYLLSSYGVRNDIDKSNPETFIPCVDGCTVREDNISLIEDFSSPDYLVVSSINIQSGEVNDTAAVLGGAQNVYCSTENLYYTFSKQNSVENAGEVTYQTETTIVKLKLGEKIETVATGNVKGYPLNQFSMDEYGGNLRIVTTVDMATYTKRNGEIISYSGNAATKNALYVLDNQLKPIGAIEDLAENERVYSVRFDGTVGYFVTFRQTDPLFTVDLKDPANPKILSELKIPGFSEYLHPYGEGRLFGFGKSATEQGSVTGLKVSMFDVSDPTDVTELHLSSVPADWSEASEDHKAIMVDAEKNIIAFVATDKYAKTRLFVYGYSEGNGFFKRTETFISEDDFYFGARFMWINNHFYMVTEDGVMTFSLDTFEKLSYLQF
ncbi:MAG: beta-propeller domain-containing protein [Clostridia bacterium]|nr:beta-propeller domain-containing protein [Clostridia bacterium]